VKIKYAVVSVLYQLLASLKTEMMVMTTIGLKAKQSVDLGVIELHFAINELEADLS